MKHKIYIFSLFAINIFLLFHTSESYAQTDTVFWFAAPAVHNFYSNNSYPPNDRPILIKLTTGQQAAIVSISQPANGGMPTQNVTIPANASQIIDVTNWIDFIENTTPDIILGYGLKITANVAVSASYEVIGGVHSINYAINPEEFSLKGKNALGTDFIIPSQNNFSNDTSGISTPMPYSCFVIVATEDNTAVTITPSRRIVGHPSGTPYTITLNKGQTYSASAFWHSAPGHLAGSEVTSDKPIAITVSDDIIKYFSGCTDLGGDQIVPVAHLGTQYIAINNEQFSSSGDFIYITATQNNTTISVNGINQTTLNKGVTWHEDMNNMSAAYIETNHPVTAWQVSGVDCQIGETLLPRLNSCSSSGGRTISYIRSLGTYIALNLTVHAGGENDFTVNGNPSVLTGNLFSPVPGTNGDWLYCHLNLNDPNATAYPIDSIIRITNSSTNFQLAVLEGGDFGPGVPPGGSPTPNTIWGTNYEYYSDFGGQTGNNDTDILGVDTVMCPGDSLTLNATISGATGYLWSTGATTPSIIVVSPGTYGVRIDGNFCSLSDTIHVFEKPSIKDLGNDTSLCLGHSITLEATTPGATGYLWNTGATTPSISVDSPGTYWAHVDGDFCNNNDTILISLRQIPPVNLGNDTTICKGSLVSLNSNASPDANELWSTGAVTPSIIVRDSGVYWVKVNYPNCGNASDTIAVNTVPCDCVIGLPTAFSPNGDGKNDIFKPIIGPGCFFKEYDFRIYNRYGQLIFRSSNPDKGWDGTQNGARVDLGVYMYYIAYRNIVNSKREIRKGDVTLLR